MDLRQRLERLRELQNLGLKRASELPPPDPADRRGRPPASASAKGRDTERLTEDRSASGLPGDRSPDAVLGGRLVETPLGSAMVVERDYPLSHSHGRAPVAGALAVTGKPLGQLLRQRGTGGWDWTRAAFFDTETTGLAGGTGTYVFLAGIGHVAGDRFRLAQFFLRDYAEESAWLWAVEDYLRPFRHLVTFNGKAFDWPLMVTRFTLDRRRAPGLGDDHLDLLHPARRLWRERLERCNLTSLEQEVLQFQRQGDVPGSLIPQLYFSYLSSGNAGPLVPVLEHNRLDILAMAALVGELGRILASPLGLDLPAADLYSLGRHFELEGQPHEAAACYEQALSHAGLPQSTRQKAWQHLSSLYKRLRRDDEAVALWRELVGRGLVGSLWPYVELAKHYEHRARDLDAARQVVLSALEVAQTRRALLRLRADDPVLQDLRHRLSRLERRLAARA